MSRVTYGTLSLVLIGCLVAALVKAQDSPKVSTGRGPTWRSASGPNPSPREQAMLRQFQSASRSVASEYLAESTGSSRGPRILHPPSGTAPLNARSSTLSPTILVSHESDGGPLQSVLKRSSDEPADLPPAVPELQSAVTPPALSPPADLKPDPSRSSRAITSVLATPPKAAGTVPSSRTDTTPQTSTTARTETSPATETGPTARVSSRRTDRTPVPFTPAESPVASRRVGSPPSTPAGETPKNSSSQTLAKVAIPSIRVDTLGPQTVTLGDEATYRILITNQSEVEAEGLAITVSVPGIVNVLSADSTDGQASIDKSSVGGARVVLNVKRLAGGADASLTLRLLPQSNEAFELATNWSLQPPASSARIDVLQPLLKLNISGVKELVYGDTDVYTIELANPGTGDAKNVSIQVAMGNDTSDKLVVGTVPAGTRKSFDVEVTAQQVGVMQIVASASGDNNLQARGAHEIMVKRADLKLQAVGPGLQYAGTVGDYAVRISNAGDATAEDVQAKVQLPVGVRYARGLDNARQEGDSLIWQVGDMAPGTHEDYRFQCELTTNGDMPFQFGATSTGGLKANGNVVTKVEAIADLKLTVNDPKGPVPVGEEVTYEIHITNRGTQAAREVSVVAQFSDGIEPVTADGMKAEIAAGQVVFTPITQIAPEDTVKLTVKARATASGNHVFRASVQCSDPETRLVAEDTTRYYGREVSNRLDALSPAAPSEENTPSPAQASQSGTGGWR